MKLIIRTPVFSCHLTPTFYYPGMKRIIHNMTIVGLVITAALIFASCKKDAHGHKEAHWGYEGETGPSSWGDLKSEFELCKTGNAQSPIDISGDMKAIEGDLEVNYTDAEASVINNGHSIQVNLKNGGSLSTGGKTYEVLQFHFHTPSEHTIDGKPADMVAHLVHKSEDGSLAVIGVLMNEGGKNSVIETIWDNMPATEGEETALPGKINTNDLLPENKGYYNYTGSLTTPPCSEDVAWFVMASPVGVENGRVSKFQSIFPKSVRPVQPLNDRSINLTGK